jgi:NAD(P)H dehydrogenase (quinone)
MRRREFITLLGGAAAAWPLTAGAQQPERMRRIGVLMSLSADDPDARAHMAALLQGLARLGWIDGRNLRIDTRWAAGDADRGRKYAVELVALAPDVVLASGSSILERHSGFGHTARQAEAVRRGIERVAGASALYLTSDEAQGRLDDLELADAIIFGAPTYMGSVSGPFKTFMDSTSKSYSTGAWKDKIAAGFTNILAAQHGMHWVSLGLPPGNNSTHGSDQDLNRLGFWLGAAAQSNADQGNDFAPPESDLLTAAHLGERVARVTQQFVRGRLPAVKGLWSETS